MSCTTPLESEHVPEITKIAIVGRHYYPDALNELKKHGIELQSVGTNNPLVKRYEGEGSIDGAIVSIKAWEMWEPGMSIYGNPNALKILSNSSLGPYIKPSK